MAKCGNIPMNTSTIANVVTMQRRKFYSKFPMKFPLITNALTTQLGTSCSFDSPGLTRESDVYSGLFAVIENNAVDVVPFIPRHFIAAFYAEKAQHLRR